MTNLYSSVMFVSIALASLLLLFNVVDIYEEAKDIPNLQFSPGSEKPENSNYYFFYTIIASSFIAIVIAYFIKISIHKNEVY